MLRAFQRDAVGLFLLNIKNPKAEETLMCFCKSQQIKKNVCAEFIREPGASFHERMSCQMDGAAD